MRQEGGLELTTRRPAPQKLPVAYQHLLLFRRFALPSDTSSLSEVPASFSGPLSLTCLVKSLVILFFITINVFFGQVLLDLGGLSWFIDLLLLLCAF